MHSGSLSWHNLAGGTNISAFFSCNLHLLESCIRHEILCLEVSLILKQDMWRSSVSHVATFLMPVQIPKKVDNMTFETT